jgi:phage-related protein
MKTTIIHSGKAYDIYGITIDNRCLVMDFINELEDADQKKIIALLQRAADFGPPRNEEKFKKLKDEMLWEFKSYQVRILCFFDKEKLIILTHGFKKQRNKTPKSEIERANKLRKEYFKERQKR